MKLDLGCGLNKRENFIGVDSIDFKGVDVVADLTKTWPWADDTVDEIHASHFIEHLTGEQRIHFANETHRVLKKGAKATLIAPHCFSERAYGDMTHQWPPVAGFWAYYLSRDWRVGVSKPDGTVVSPPQAPHDDISNNPKGYSCDFDATWGYNTHPALSTRNAEYQQFAVSFYKEAIQDIIFTLTKK